MSEFLLGALAGACGVWLALRTPRRLPGPAATSDEVAPHLLPDPALGWLKRAHGALGVWVAELDPEDQAPMAERIVDGERLSIPEIVAVDRRLERARSEAQSGVERMERGTLVYHTTGHVAAALLLPESETAAVRVADDDLRRLLAGIQRRPQIVALAQAQTQGASLESVGSVGLRLAYQLERITGSEAVVGVNEPAGVRIVGLSGRADRRMLNVLAAADSPLARVARGEVGEQIVPADPLGNVVMERRKLPVPILIIPLRAGGDAVGAIALWLPEGREPSIVARAEIMQTLADAAPRLARGLEADGLREAATVDALTGLANRRALEATMNQPGPGAGVGALVVADLDNFKVLNDTLGHPAGDAALIHFARLIREQIRATDAAARTGGEEFAVWLPGADLALGRRTAESIRAKLASTRWDWAGRTWPLSASFGVAACPETSRSVENLALHADAALYKAKGGGKDRVEAAPGR